MKMLFFFKTALWHLKRLCARRPRYWCVMMLQMMKPFPWKNNGRVSQPKGRDPMQGIIKCKDMKISKLRSRD